MFFRRPNKDQAGSTETSQCEDRIALLKTIADEKCRSQRTYGSNPNVRTSIWTKEECTQASKKVIEQVEECLSLKRKGPG